MAYSKEELDYKRRGELEDKNKRDRKTVEMGAGLAATQAAQQATQAAAVKFAKPATYTGNRTLYDSGAAKHHAKVDLFKSGNKVVDPYTGKDLVLTKQEAKMLYGDKWTEHLAEVDHIKPLERIYDETRNNPWLTNDNIRDIANDEHNLQVTSRKINNAKRSRTNEELANDTEYQRQVGLDLSEQDRQNLRASGRGADKWTKKQELIETGKNIVKTGHQAGMQGAKTAGTTALTMSGIMNVVSVIKGEKTGEEAIVDTIKTGGKAAVTGYAMTGGLTVVSNTLTASKSKFVRGLAQSNIPGKVITAVMVTGDTLKKWGNGEITTEECLIELGDKGLNMLTMGYATAIGQTLIPIPVVGGAIGALVGSMLTSSVYNHLIGELQRRKFEHEERLRIIAECQAMAEQTKAFRKELESYLDEYFRDFRDCFDSALSSMSFSFETGDADGVIAGANEITRKLGGEVRFETVSEFASFLDDDTCDVF